MLKLATFEDTALHVFHEAKEKTVTYHSKIVSCDNNKIFRENNLTLKHGNHSSVERFRVSVTE